LEYKTKLPFIFTLTIDGLQQNFYMLPVVPRTGLGRTPVFRMWFHMVVTRNVLMASFVLHPHLADPILYDMHRNFTCNI